MLRRASENSTWGYRRHDPEHPANVHSLYLVQR
jgi:hypothetical protein